MSEPKAARDDAALDAEDEGFGERVLGDHPVPAAAFRGALGRHLAAADPGYGHRPPRLLPTAGAYIAGGAVLLALGALSAAGAL